MKNLFLVLLSFFSCTSFAQEIICDNKLVSEAYNLAINTIDINTRRGILAAGGDYGGEWTRDIAINSWNGVSILKPDVAEKSLWSVTLNKDTIGHQYWDKIIWVISAFNHYKVTGNKEFLKQAFKCSANTMAELEKKAFDIKYGLFNGPSVFNDGIAGYPPPIYDSLNKSSFVLAHPQAKTIKCLSTNCIYYGAYLALKEMSQLTGKDPLQTKAYEQKAENLKSNILKYLLNKEENRFNYFIDNNGKPDKSQEALGLSFAVILGIVEKENAKPVIANAVTSKYGITSIYPDFTRYSSEKPGRHNNLIWPMVNGFFAKAAIIVGNKKVFSNEFTSLTHLALDEDKGNYNFREIYNPNTGKPDGGWQSDHEWASCKHQTWSATAYIDMVLSGLIGLRINDNTITFEPFLPGDIHSLEIKNIKYHKAVLDIKISGNGSNIKSFMLNGKKKKDNKISSSLKGNNKISIILE